jgi:hypothetical protein
MNYWNSGARRTSRNRRRSREGTMKVSALVLFFGGLAAATVLLVEGLPR